MENFAINKEQNMMVCTLCGSEATVYENCESSDKLYVCGTVTEPLGEQVILVNDYKNVWAEAVSHTAECNGCGAVENVLVQWV